MWREMLSGNIARNRIKSNIDFIAFAAMTFLECHKKNSFRLISIFFLFRLRQVAKLNCRSTTERKEDSENNLI